MHSAGHPARNINAVILAGGEGRRLGQGPKAMVMLAGQPLVAHAIARITQQVPQVAIGLRASAAWAESFSLEIITDDIADAGPLAGVAAAMAWAARHHAMAVLTCPTDVPFVPLDLAARLADAMTNDTNVVVASSGGQLHHLAALWRTDIYERLATQLRQSGALAVHAFLKHCRVLTVDWPTVPFDPFFNINTAGDLTVAEGICSSAAEQEIAPP